MNWICKQCETENVDVDVCEVCGSHRKMSGVYSIKDFIDKENNADINRARELMKELQDIVDPSFFYFHKYKPITGKNIYEEAERQRKDYNFSCAFKGFKKAAEIGYTKAFFWVAELLRCGDGVTKNWEEAVNWYKKAAEYGDMKALFWLGRCYEIGGDGLEQNEDKAIEWYEKAVKKGDSIAKANLDDILSKRKKEEKLLIFCVLIVVVFFAYFIVVCFL